MPEPYYVFCAVCEQSFDKWSTPTCPRCSDVRAPKKRSDGARAKSKPPRPVGTSASKPPRDARSAASLASNASVTRDRPVTAAAAARSVRDLVGDDQGGNFAFVQRAPLWGAAGFALGLFLYPLALNLMMEKPLFELPVLEHVRGAEIVTTGAHAKTEGPVQVQVKLEQRSLEVVDWHREPGESPGTVKYVGTVLNTSPGQVTKAIVQMHAEDLGGRELAKGWGWVQPSVLDPQERGSFEIELRQNDVAANVRVTAGWHQYFKAELKQIDPQAASSYFADSPSGPPDDDALSALELARADTSTS